MALTIADADRAVEAALQATCDALGRERQAYYHINSRSDLVALRMLLATAIGEWMRR